MTPPHYHIFSLQSLLQFFILANVVSASYVFNKPQVRVTTTFTDFHARVMDQWGSGGGKFVKISSDSHHSFQGRTFGGAERKEIRGSRTFGSGYPYGATDPLTVAGRPFPFGTWPLWWDQQFMESNEYGPHRDTIRPGGFIVSVPFRTTKEHFNVTDDEVYYAIGDREMMLSLLVSYVTSCHVVPAWPSRFDPRLSNSTIKLENVIQYFRASSFALASPAYNNTHAHLPPSPSPSPSTTNDSSSPLPELIEYSPFRRCIDDVTYHALAIMNKPPGTTPLQRFILALKVAAPFILTGFLYVPLLAFLGIAELRFWLWEFLFPERMDRIRAARQSEFPYENYP
ncbi:hypothetical protein FRC17_003271 [Serendipita sp. 399]|nr:hypothetical protein FRC17_003271 [Serendipita sp. 399]